MFLAAPQGVEPRYAAPEAAVLPLNEGAAKQNAIAFAIDLGFALLLKACAAIDLFIIARSGVEGQTRAP